MYTHNLQYISHIVNIIISPNSSHSPDQLVIKASAYLLPSKASIGGLAGLVHTSLQYH